jgi:sulfatase maturation enzyme AslB (radical SAM superfamily)
MKTAVEWLVEQMKKCNMTVSVHNTSHQNVMDFYKAIEQAKEMEKQKTIDFAYDIADDLACGVLSKKAIEDRYNEFFKSE